MPPTPRSLFDDDPDPMPIDGLLVPRSKASPPRSKKERAVSRLLAQVESLRTQHAREKQRLDDALIFQAAHVTPRLERLTRLRTDVVRALARVLDDRRLGKADSRALCEILVEQLDHVLAHTGMPDPDLKALFKRLHGVGLDDVVQEELEEARSGMAAIFDELGLDMDVPELRPDMSEEEMAATAARMADRMRQAEEARVGKTTVRRKTKRELREAERAQRVEQVRKISIGAIYRRLVKVLHPDLERDPSLRERKTGVMQEVTAAHAGGDLHTLLRLELEWIDGDGPAAARRTDETLDAYTELLRQQVAQLRLECMELPFHPRYQSLMAADDPFGVRPVDGVGEVRRLDAAIEELTFGFERLSDEPAGLREVRELIREFRRVRGRPGRRR